MGARRADAPQGAGWRTRCGATRAREKLLVVRVFILFFIACYLLYCLLAALGLGLGLGLGLNW